MPNFFKKLKQRIQGNQDQEPTEAQPENPQTQNANDTANAGGLLSLLNGGGNQDHEAQIKRSVERNAATKLIMARYSRNATPEEKRQSIEFEVFCYGEYAEENLNFVRDVYSIVVDGDGQLSSHLEYLQNRYVGENAKSSINVPDALRKQLSAILGELVPNRDVLMSLLSAAVFECLKLLQGCVNRFHAKNRDREDKAEVTFRDDVNTRLRRDARIASAKANRRIRLKHLRTDWNARQHAGDNEKRNRSFDEYVNKVQAPNKLMFRPNYQITRKMGRGYDQGTLDDWLRLTGRNVYRPLRPIQYEPTEEEE